MTLSRWWRPPFAAGASHQPASWPTVHRTRSPSTRSPAFGRSCRSRCSSTGPAPATACGQSRTAPKSTCCAVRRASPTAPWNVSARVSVRGVTVRRAGALAASSYLELGADDGQVGRICRGAGATGFLHAELDDHPLAIGEVLHAELVPRVKRYSARIMRPIAVAEIPAGPQALAERLVFHQDRQIAAMVAGARASDVDAVLREALLHEGIRDRYANVTGYMLGIYGRTPRSSDFSHALLPTSDWRLEAAWCFTCIPRPKGLASATRCWSRTAAANASPGRPGACWSVGVPAASRGRRPDRTFLPAAWPVTSMGWRRGGSSSAGGMTS